MVKVIGIIGARLNSSRLPAKHLLDLAGRPMIDHIFDRLSRVPEIDKLVLATTHDDFNQPLIQWAHDHQREVFAYEGDVNDLIGRMDAIVHKEDPEIVCYFCGDNPLLDPAMLSRLIQQLQATPAADYVEFIPSPGPYRFIHESFNIYRRTVWDRMVASSTSPFEREHVGQGLRHFKDQLRMTYADEEPLFCSVEHRLSVDTPSDYTFMTSIYERWYAENPANTIVSLRWVIEQLLKDPVLRVINEDVRQKDAQERSHKVAVITQCGKDVGLGHLSRAMVAARACQDHLSAGVIVGIYGEEVAANQLALIPHRWLNDNEALEFTGVDTLLIDLHPQHHPVVVRQMIRQAHEAGVSVVVIDGIYDMPDQVDVFFIPSFMLPANIAAIEHPTVHYGWDHFLLQPAEPITGSDEGVLIMTGGSDTMELGHKLPPLLAQALSTATQIHWIKGPFAAAPEISEASHHHWQIHDNPPNLQQLMANVRCALVPFGVSFFELLLRGVPTVVFSPYGTRDTELLTQLKKENVAIVVENAEEGANAIGVLLQDEQKRSVLKAAIAQKPLADGPRRLTTLIKQLWK